MRGEGDETGNKELEEKEGGGGGANLCMAWWERGEKLNRGCRGG